MGQVSCVECHPPHRDDRLRHFAARFWAGGKDLSVHLSGRYDAENNLATCPSSARVTIVHDAALKRASDRAHACVTCHDAFHGPRPEHLYCTDCHGQHMTPNRTRRWDKETRQLIEVDGRRVSPAEACASPLSRIPGKS